jgi:hypothetical protein
MAFPIKDLSGASPRSGHDATFTYNMDDINRVAAHLGIPWEESKDIPFGTVIRYIGLEWESRTPHTLREVQILHGKLLHACHIFPARAVLT